MVHVDGLCSSDFVMKIKLFISYYFVNTGLSC